MAKQIREHFALTYRLPPKDTKSCASLVMMLIIASTASVNAATKVTMSTQLAASEKPAGYALEAQRSLDNVTDTTAKIENDEKRQYSLRLSTGSLAMRKWYLTPAPVPCQEPEYLGYRTYGFEFVRYWQPIYGSDHTYLSEAFDRVQEFLLTQQCAR
jgi:hypothetical protein